MGFLLFIKGREPEEPWSKFAVGFLAHQLQVRRFEFAQKDRKILARDRIVLGEVRGREAMTFLEAINTGHGGSLTTLHAETPQLAVRRLAIAALKTDVPMTYADMIDYIEGSIDVIIQAGRHEGARGITEFFLPGQSKDFNLDSIDGRGKRNASLAAE